MSSIEEQLIYDNRLGGEEKGGEAGVSQPMSQGQGDARYVQTANFETLGDARYARKGQIATPFTQTYATAEKTHAARTASAVSVTVTNVTPYGFATEAGATSLVTAINALRNDQLDTAQVLNALINDLRTLGLVS